MSNPHAADRIETLEEGRLNPTIAISYRLTTQAPRCLVGGCRREVAAELHCGYYAQTLRAMGYRLPHKRRCPGDARVFVCDQHLGDEQLNARLRHPRWQRLFDYAGDDK